ncbi:MAG: SH3 domain-containing protein [Pseudomonadota bacterium]
MRKRWMLLPLCGALAAVSAGAQSVGQNRPVMIGLDGPDFDACGALGEVANLNPRGDNYLSVRASPSTSGTELNRLGPGTRVLLCDGEGDGWIGIVYGSGADGELLDCQATDLVPQPRAYDGPCNSGWVHGDYISVIAG